MKYVSVQARRQLKMVNDVSKLLGNRKYWDCTDRIVFNSIKYALINKLESELVR
jgi:hypothetical protein